MIPNHEMTVQSCQDTFIIMKGELKLINYIIKIFGVTFLIINVAIWCLLKGLFCILSAIPYIILRATAPMIKKVTKLNISKRYSLFDFMSDIVG